MKKPFVELLKGSLQTFLNAFTYPDRTCYPVASTNVKVIISVCTLENIPWSWIQCPEILFSGFLQFG